MYQSEVNVLYGSITFHCKTVVALKMERNAVKMMASMPHYDSVLIILALVLLVAAPVAAENAAGLSWTISHSWRPNQDFVRRGTLSWNPEKNDAGDSVKESSSVFQIYNDDKSANLTANDVKDMLDYGWYHVKIQGDSFDETHDNFVFQTVPACNLRRANFKDQFDITLPRSSLGDRQDPITSFAYTPLVSPLAPKSCDYETNDDEKVKTFSSKVTVQLDTPAMTLKNILSQSKPPPGLALMKQPQQQGGGGEQNSDGSGGDNYDDSNPPPNPVPSPFSFLQKYWYIILPMLILQFIQSPAEEKKEGSEPQEGNEDQSSNNATSTPVKTRRGKHNKNN